MVLGRYVVDAIVLEGRSPTELAKSHCLSRTWIYDLVKRFRSGGYWALEPRSRSRACARTNMGRRSRKRSSRCDDRSPRPVMTPAQTIAQWHGHAALRCA